MQTLLMLLAIWIGVNALHAAWVGVRRFFWERRFVRGADGLLPEAEAYTVGEGTVGVLFIHGFADTPRIWQRVAERLAATGGFTCRAMRLPGSAEPALRARDQSLARWRAEVDAELARLGAAHATVWIAGHSLGGALALDAALREPGKVAGVAALAPMIEVSRRRSPVLPPRVWLTLARLALALSPTFESCFSPKGEAVDDPSFTYIRDRFIPFPVYGALFDLIHANRGQAARLGCPVFAVTSERDSVVDTPAALRWLDACPGPKKVRARDDIGHVVPLEIGWKEMTDALAAFVRNPAEQEGKSQ